MKKSEAEDDLPEANFNDNNKDSQRENWSHRIEYLLSMVGYSVGLGNIWRFPYICMRNGGGAFLIPFVFFLVTCGLPLYFLEISVGQFMGKGVISVWNAFPLFRGIGIGILLSSAILSFYYNIITAWVLYYIVNSFINPIPWSTCDNDWNTQFCVSKHLTTSKVVSNQNMYPSAAINNISGYDTERNVSFITNTNISSAEEFWQNQVLQMSSGIDDIGTLPWHLPVCYLTAWILICLCLIKGVRSVGKVVYVTATMPYIILAVLFVRGVTLPGGVWLEAALQVFYSLGPCCGGLITMDAISLTFLSEGTSIYGGLAIFSILGYMAKNGGKPINEVITSGPGLGFIGYPEAMMLLPIPNLWAVLFFVMLLTVALDTLFVTVEIILTALLDSCPTLKNKTLITIVSCLILFLLGLPMCTQAGIYIFQLLDWYIGALSPIVFGILECINFGWIYAILLVTFVFTMVSYRPPNFGSYYYPMYAQAIGWVVAGLPIIPLPVFGIIEIRKSKGSSIAKKIRSACRPSHLWRPNDRSLCKQQENDNRDSETPFMK
ncbi:hypothetical protein KUTeg_003672 [Tegillarca granosa]|uniref:Transporter n=1 Tax=Tegillarca granosa TaxID=220873 RepID=A0ABQ9FQZ9_TEGGR|nr:hypothetical protein KUTeg_003672 [Tegillarca granosa]